MSVSSPFILRPVGTILLTFGLAVAGAVALGELPVAALPQVDYPTIVITTALPGASAETMASAVTTPLERQLGQIPSLTQITSISSQSTSQITLQFDLDRSIDAAQQDVQAAINATSNLLPRTLPFPPTYSKSNPADAPILTLSLSSSKLSLTQVNDYADSLLAQRISQVAGVGIVTLNGGQRPAVRIQVDPPALAAAGLTLEDVRSALVAANVNQPKGNIDGPRQNFTIEATDQLRSAAAYRPLVLAYAHGAPIRLDDVADAVDGVENATLAGWANGERAILLNVQRQPGANVIEVAEAVKTLLRSLESTLPQGLRVEVIADRTSTVRASVHDVELTLALTVILVVLVIYVFLRSPRATLIPSVAVPLSLLGTFGAMYFLGFSLNNLSLMALTISTGFVVDDAIVMLENIARHIENGKAPKEAALIGAKEIGFTIISLTLSLVAVLIPLLFMGGLVGRLFREFALTLTCAILVSAALSLTLTPMLAAYILKAHPTAAAASAKPDWFLRAFDAMLGFYRRTLLTTLQHQRAVLWSVVGTSILVGVLAWQIPKGFFPQQDTGLIVGSTEAASEVSFDQMRRLQERVVATALEDPDVATSSSFIGADGTNLTGNTGRINLSLKPRDQRAASVEEVIARLNAALHGIPGISVYLQPSQDLQLDNRRSRTQYQWTLEGADPEALALWVPRIAAALKRLPELADVASDQQETGPITRLTIDRDTASRLGVSAQAIDDTLYDAFGQRQVTTIFTQLNLYRVILEVKPGYSTDERALQQLFVRSSDGTPISLSQIVHIQRDVAPLTIAHQGQFQAVTLSFNTAPGVSLGDAVTAIERARSALEVPSSIRASFQGATQAFSESLASQPLLILAALLTVYIVLGVLYESFIHPLTILSTLPSAGVGALLALLFTGTHFTIIALIGIILLIGIVKKNAIMMIDFAVDAERERGLSPRDAIFEACLLRFRPIMMTTMAALLGALPLAFGTGTGSELRRPLGITIVGGLVLSQVLTLYSTPVIYLFMGRFSRKRSMQGVPAAKRT